MTDTEQFLRERFKSLITSANESKEVTDRIFVELSLLPLETLDDLEQAFVEFTHYLKHNAYYDTLERIEKGEGMLEAETDEDMRTRYKARLRSLYTKLESYQAKEEIA